MFGKKRSQARPQSPKTPDASPAKETALEGELLIEQLFVEDKPSTKTSKLAALSKDVEIIDVKATPVKSSGKTGAKGPGLFGRLFRSKPKTAVSPAAEKIELQKTSEELAREARPGASANGKKAGKKTSRLSKERYIAVDLGQERTLFWRLTAGGIEQVDTVPDGTTAISFSAEDRRIATETPVSQGQAEALAVEELTEAAQLVNRSKDLRAIYVTRKARTETLSYRIGPGQLLLDRLAKERARDAEALVIALELKDKEGRDALLILYYLSSSGRSSAPQISVYPDNRDVLLSQFAAANQAVRENAQVLELDHAALLSAVNAFVPYPNEPMLGPLPVRKVWAYAAFLAMLSAAGSAVYAYQTWLEYKRSHAELIRLQGSVEQAQHANKLRLESSPRALARAVSLDVGAIFRFARGIWIPGGRVSVSADGRSEEYVLTLPLLSGASSDRRLAVPVGPQLIRQILERQLPEGCRRDELNFAGNFNEAQLYIRCEAASHPLDRYRSY